MLESDAEESRELLLEGIKEPAYEVRRSLVGLPAEVGEHSSGTLKVEPLSHLSPQF